VSAAASLAVVVPVPLDASAAARVGVHLREAIRKVNNGEYGDAVTEARKAIDAMDGRAPDWQSERQIATIRREERTISQRLGMLRHALHGLASPAAHGDDVAAEIKWDRENALAVIAGISALAACRISSPDELPVLMKVNSASGRSTPPIAHRNWQQRCHGQKSPA
jgi:hypothetical protein